jgi:hypothetical protein
MKDAQKSVLLPYEKYIRLLAGAEKAIQKEVVREPEVQSEEIDPSVDGLTVDAISDTVPQRYRKRIESILNYITRDPRRTLHWNEKGQLIYKDSTVSDSHITDLLKDSQFEHKGYAPVGYVEFYKGLKEINLPVTLIGNSTRRREFVHRPPGIPAAEKKKKKKKATLKWIAL